MRHAQHRPPPPPVQKPKRLRKVVQIMAQNDQGESLYALCDDGTIWQISNSHDWVEMPAIPQDQEPDLFVIGEGCLAHQTSDQMTCAACDKAWDMNDPFPPTCGVDVPAKTWFARLDAFLDKMKGRK